MTEHVIGIDPGLDGVGVAWLSRTAGTIVVREVVTVRTKASLTITARLVTIQRELATLLATWHTRYRETAGSRDPWCIAIEVPSRAGRYQERSERGGAEMTAVAMMKFWQALGVIRATAASSSGATVVDIPPGGAKKEYRQEMFSRWTGAGRNPDERDAIVIACVHLFTSASVADLALATARPR